MLDETKINCIEYLIAGVEKTEIAKLIGKSRQAIYDWINKDNEFKAELAKRLRERKTEATRKINNKLPQAIDKIWYLIENAQSEKVKSDLLKYWIDRELGTPTSRVADVTEDKDKKEDFVNLDNIVEDIKTDNVIELDKKKAK